MRAVKEHNKTRVFVHIWRIDARALRGGQRVVQWYIHVVHSRSTVQTVSEGQIDPTMQFA